MKNENLIQIGFWYSDVDSIKDFPKVETAMGWSWDPVERARVAEYLKFGKKHEQWRGSSACRVCGLDNGSQDLTDGFYVWPQGYAHYVLEHGVKPPQDFIDLVLHGVNDD
jgi:hypothetical protein